jgi:hypothetical protein
MTSVRALVFSGLILVTPALFAQDSPVPSDAEIRKILADRVGQENLGVGMVVGVVDAKGRHVQRGRTGRRGHL